MEILPGILARRVGANRAAATLQRQRRLPRSEVDNLVDLYATGINARQLAAAFGINRDTALQLLQRRGISSRATARKLTDELLATATRRYLAGEPMAKLCGISASTRPPCAGNSPRPASSFADPADPQSSQRCSSPWFSLSTSEPFSATSSRAPRRSRAKPARPPRLVPVGRRRSRHAQARRSRSARGSRASQG